MNAGKLNERLTILQYDDDWQPICTVWCNAKQNSKKNIFSSVGIGAQSVEFVIRSRKISLHNALIWRKRHCFVTGIFDDDSKMFLRLSAAIVNRTECFCYREEIALNETRNPVRIKNEPFYFSAAVTEKYTNYQRGEPQDSTTKTLVLVTPKSIKLKAGDVVQVGNLGKYHVTVTHIIDEYKNEYEVEKKIEGGDICQR